MSVSRKIATKNSRQQSILDLLDKPGEVKTVPKATLSPSDEDMRDIVKEESANKQFTEEDKLHNERYRRYYDAKIVAMKLEQVNNSKLILFPSVTEGEQEEWYKMGGNSALFYKNVIGPRMGRKNIKIRQDNDMNHRFSGGITSVHWKRKFIENMVKLGYEKFEENELGMLFFDLETKFTKNEIEGFREREKKDKDRINQMIVPKNLYPDLYGLFLQLAKLLPPKIKRMHPAYREMFQGEFIVNLMAISKNYTKMANGEIAKTSALGGITEAADNLLALLAIIAENGLFGVAECAKIGEIIMDAKMTAKRHLTASKKSVKKKNGD